MPTSKITPAQKRVLLILLQSDRNAVEVKDLAVDPSRPGIAWRVVQKLKEMEPKALVKTGRATGPLAGTDNSTVPVNLTVAGRNAARDLQ
jgi:hypothetical protein